MLTTNAPPSPGTSIQSSEPGRRTCSPRLPGSASSRVSTPESLCGPTPCAEAARAGYRITLISVAGAAAKAASKTSGGLPSEAAQCRSKVRATPDSAASHSAMIPGHSGSAAGPWVGPLQPQVGALAGPADRRPLRSDVDLFAPVHLAAGQLATQPGVAAEMRTAHHRDGNLVRRREREEPARRLEHPARQRRRNFVTGQIAETHLMSRLPKALTQLAKRRPQVDHRQRSDARHSTHSPIIVAAQAACHRLDLRESNRLVD